MDAIKIDTLNALFHDISSRNVMAVVAIKDKEKALVHLMAVPQLHAEKIEKLFKKHGIPLIHVPVFEGDFGPLEVTNG